jgi:predicted nuclease with TOPRIM domain
MKLDHDLMKDVGDILKLKEPERHSFFQLNFFIIGKEPTHQAKLRKCVDELKLKRDELNSIKLQVEDLEDKNELMYIEMSKFTTQDRETELRIQMVERRVQQNNNTIDTLSSRARSVEEEVLFLVQAFRQLNDKEPMKDWDDIEVQKEYWNAKLAEEISHRLLMQLPIDMELVKTALALPGGVAKDQIVSLLQKQSKKITGEKDSISIVA